MNVKTLCGEAARPAGFARLCIFVAVQLTPKALTLLAYHGFCLRGLTLELSRPLRQDAGPARPMIDTHGLAGPAACRSGSAT